MNQLLWAVLPYIALTLMIAGLIWRWRTDQFGWTSRSSQLYEGPILRAASPMFHFGILAVAAGHAMGLIFPEEFTEALGVSHHLYHLVATIGGTVAGVVTVIGLGGLIYRRVVYRSVRLATTRNDLVMYVLLVIPIVLGATATVANQILGPEGGYNYRETISVWFRSIFMLQPNVAVMEDVPVTFKLHIVAALVLFAVWPFTRLVHAVTPPVGYVARPAIIYRSRSAATQTTEERRGWAPVRGGRAGNTRGSGQGGQANPHGA